MNTIFNYLEKKFDTLALREKILVFFGFLLIFYTVWSTILYDYVLATDQEIAERAQQLKAQLRALEGSIDNASQALGRDPTEELRRQLQVLKEENRKTDRIFSEKLNNMVSPKNMTKILDDLIKKTEGLKIVGMSNLVSTELVPMTTIENDGKIISFQVFKHGLKVEMTGRYFETLNFLKALESLSLPILWEEIDYQVQKYPQAKITIVLYTLSLGQGWIGV